MGKGKGLARSSRKEKDHGMADVSGTTEGWLKEVGICS